MLQLFQIKFYFLQILCPFQNTYMNFKVDCSLHSYIYFFVLLIQELQKLGICPEDPRLKCTVYTLGQLAFSPCYVSTLLIQFKQGRATCTKFISTPDQPRSKTMYRVSHSKE